MSASLRPRAAAPGAARARAAGVRRSGVGLHADGPAESVLLHVTGVVQGVGFRPFVHRLAERHRLAGWVRNESGDVLIAIEGAGERIEAFIGALRVEAPPLARIDGVRATPRDPVGVSGFTIASSDTVTLGRQPVSPDVAMCADCAREFSDPADRRHRYPFITCTNCGPRHSVIESMPYDRERTTMHPFVQCPECAREYESIADRRYHSETNSCPVCGPRLRFFVPGVPGVERRTEQAIAAAARVLRDGGVVAVRGIGGFHLAADATSDDAVRRLRERKHRDAKPLAVMVRTLDEARALGHVSPREAEWLTSAERPIVILRRRAGAPVASGVSGALGTVGVMLAYAPLQFLLLEAAGRPLVMTSGNRSRDPLAITLDDALRTLSTIADAFLTHDREIVARIDDSVLRVAGDSTILVRRARGFAPLPVPLPIAAPEPLVAVGAHQKNTFAVADGGHAYVSQHVGDLETIETMDHWQRTLESFERLFRVTPTVAVRDLHPGYLSTVLAGELGLSRVIDVQHHHAHVAAVAAEHGVTTPVVGLAWDGTGYGEDGRIWGAECLVGDLVSYRRAGQLRYAPLPGGDAAVRAPWRSAIGYLSLEPALDARLSRFTTVDERERDVVWRQAVERVNAPEASSMGRLFDAASALLGVCTDARFEGEGAMLLESLAGDLGAEALPVVEYEEAGRWVADPVPLLAALGELRARGADPAVLAATFHESVAEYGASVAGRVAAAEGTRTVVLSGGVFQNARLLGSVSRRLRARGLTVLVPRLLPPNDGAICYGQAAVAAARLCREAAGD